MKFRIASDVESFKRGEVLEAHGEGFDTHEISDTKFG